MKYFFALLLLGSLINPVASQDISLFTPLAGPSAKHYTPGTELDELPEHFKAKLPLGEAREVNVTFDRQPATTAGLDIYWGQTQNSAWGHLAHYRDALLVVSRTTGTALAYVNNEAGSFVVEQDGQGLYKSHAAAVHACEAGYSDRERLEKSNFVTPAEVKSLMAGCGERDAAGNYVADIYFGFTHEAVEATPDINVYTAAQVEIVNMALSNTMIEDLRMRLVDIGVGDNHIGVFSETLQPFFDFFRDEIDRAGADFGAFFDGRFPGSANGGWGDIGGRKSVNFANSPTVFRHEWGHNTGSNHCFPDGAVAPYANGHSNGNVGSATIMCGNNLQFYSNPDINDGQGTPIGVEDQSDNHRSITERRAIISGYATHIIPYEATDEGDLCPTPVAEDVDYYIVNRENGKYMTIGSASYVVLEDAPSTASVWNIHRSREGRYYLNVAGGNRAIFILSFSNESGIDVAVLGIGTDSRQQFNITPADPGFFYIRSIGLGGQCLQAQDGEQPPNEDWLLRAACSDEADNQWQFVAVPNADPATDISITSTPNTCLSGASGSLTANVANSDGTTTYEWSNGATSATINNLVPGGYNVTVVDNGRTYITEGTVMAKPALIPDITITRNTPSTAGAVTVNSVANAVAPLTYAWSDGGTGASRTDLAAGLHTVTITDADGCQDDREVRILSTLDDGEEYVIQHVASGLYVYPREGATDNNAIVLGSCPTDTDLYRWRSEVQGGSEVAFYNVESDRRLTNVFRNMTGGVLNLTSFDYPENRFQLTPTGIDTWSIKTVGGRYDINVSSNEAGAELVQSEEGSDGIAAEFRFIRIVACTPDPSGTACKDNDNTTDDDQINLLCGCCGTPNACFGIGDGDGDGECADTDCDDDDIATFAGAPCDDGVADNFGDTYDEQCACVGRPKSCTESGQSLVNVALFGTPAVRNTFSGSASMLNDGEGVSGTFTPYWWASAHFSWAEIQLQQTQAIREIVIFPRRDTGNPGMGGASVFVNDQPWSSADLGIAGTRAEAEFEFAIPADYTSTGPLVIQANTTGRYVRIKAANDFLQLSEIEVRVCPQEASALPVDLLEFTGEATAKTNRLWWRTAREVANDGFTVQRSADGRTFTDLGWVAGVGTSPTPQDYEFIDRAPPTGASYYRLRQRDLSGAESLSPVVVLRRTAGAPWRVFPNPTEGRAGLTIRGLPAGEGAFELYDATGRQVRSYAPGLQVLSVRQLSPGLYLLRNAVDGSARRVVVR